ncbi:bifunctional adenosylcobinamide kinase/adenosylcobinamide-phosphate guanylyltransferase [Leptodesmis sichuanensis A121]|nr:bifunctional adenosylcobinamide kinase/adenosylcobinamide-phosphate guanylyltransferase [Leptodesmis sichuanensis]UIE40588.1 bifunctional adenosylcobinamide kinase/adenosylcobinamide-phosphate guanylyltransferase [Leptodesmis sichuanensis A121]
MSRQIILVTGAARSGKSEWAEELAQRSHKRVTYVATAQLDAADPEWQQRIQRHQQRRPAAWATEWVPEKLAAAIQFMTEEDCFLVDSLGTWLANLLALDEQTWQAQEAGLLQQLEQTAGTVILVAEETGWGVVPAYAAGRLFRDRLGNLIRQVGAIADTVYLVTGGYAVNVSAIGIPLPQPTDRP